MISMHEIQRYCDAIATTFQPLQIILFGSYAWGSPTEDSDVDVLVIMPKKRFRRDLDLKIRRRVPAAFPVDVLVRDQEDLTRRQADGECFILDVTENGKVMYEASDS
jgi:predicted nucleotidyltransferase